jgi:hypothetical protein
MAATYKSLEGKIIRHIDIKGKERRAIIAGCSKDIGITIKEYKMGKKIGMPLFCWHGPFSVHGRKKNQRYTKKDWLSIQNTIKMLRKGYFSEGEDIAFDKYLGFSIDPNLIASEETCPFGQ